METAILQEIGLTDSEIEVYLDLVKHGESLASAVSKRTGLNRTHTYDRLNRLLEKGFISYVVRNNRKYFRPADPERVLDYFEMKKGRVEKLIENIAKIKTIEKKELKVEVFLGKEGLKTASEDELKGSREIFILGAKSDYSERLKYYVPHYHKRRIKSRIKFKAIFEKGSEKRAEEVRQMKYAEVKFLPKQHSSPMTIVIFKDKVDIQIVSEKPIAIVITDEGIADGFKKYFQLLWTIARK